MANPKSRTIVVCGAPAVGRYNFFHLPISCFSPIVGRINRTLWCTGKSSLTIQFVENHFVDSYYPTIQSAYNKVIRFRGQEIAAEIIDTAGQVSNKQLWFRIWSSHKLVPTFVLLYNHRMNIQSWVRRTRWEYMVMCSFTPSHPDRVWSWPSLSGKRS